MTHPANQGLICRKMQNYETSVNSEKDPYLFAVPVKGSGQFMPVTWKKQEMRIAERFLKIIREDGPQAIPSCCLFRVSGRDPEKVRGSIF